ncbi:hypothetical protein [Brachybacterium sp. Marseille-Q7125]|uniref:hypothetical protein n=1 Tax=Brachybacterium sp. Marseille-Q7125 TaxID=2932815 RepID=UPI001FF476F9|nr:hypothetical protein [Brachybacterium sp. Marseille-Q7125]
MAYVRKVRTASGAVAVQVVQKSRGRLEVLEHVGSAHTDAELGLLLERAEQVLQGEQMSLGLQVPRAVTRVEDVADWSGRTQTSGLAARPVVAPSGRVLSSTSRLVYDVLASAYIRLGFDVVGDRVFRDLVIARLIEPASKVESLRVLAE